MLLFGNSCLLLNKNIKMLNDYSEIEIIIKGNVKQKILSKSFTPLPNSILINGIGKTVDHEYDLIYDRNNITIRWDNSITNL